jgi:hypothetical protein
MELINLAVVNGSLVVFRLSIVWYMRGSARCIGPYGDTNKCCRIYTLHTWVAFVPLCVSKKLAFEIKLTYYLEYK